MTSERRAQLQAILGRLEGTEPVMARVMAADERAEIRSMPSEIREVELPFTARSYYVLVAQAMTEGRGLSEAELEGVRERGVQRALEGFPLHLFVHNWMRGATVLWEAAVAVAGADEADGLIEFSTGLLRILNQATTAGAEAFAAARAAVETHDRGDARLVARLLLDGQDPTSVAHERGVRVTGHYDVLALSIAPSEEELTEAAAADVAGRRKLLRIATALRRGGLGEVLTLLDPRGGHALVPRSPDSPAAPAAPAVVVDESRCRRVVEAIASAAGTAVTATASTAPHHGAIPRAARDADEMLQVALTTGRGAGFHGVDGLAVQLQASLPGVAREHLLTVLGRLDRHPELVETIDRLLALDGDRGRTARSLGVHPNTVNNRLAKAHRLLGFDPTSTQGMVAMYAALTARRVSAPVADPLATSKV